MCLFIAHSITPHIDMKASGGKNPLVEAAAQMTLLPDERRSARTAAEVELDEMRGERIGYETDQTGRAKMQDDELRTPTNSVPGDTDTFVVDEDDNVVGVDLGKTEPGEIEEKFARQATKGSFEAFMRMLGTGGTPPPTGPKPG